MPCQGVRLTKGETRLIGWFESDDEEKLKEFIKRIQDVAPVGQTFDEVVLLGSDPPQGAELLPIDIHLVDWLTDHVIRRGSETARPKVAREVPPARKVDVPRPLKRPTRPPAPDMLTPQQAAEILGLDLERTVSLIECGKLRRVDFSEPAWASRVLRSVVEDYQACLPK